jgi:hypothetical protein
MASPIFWASFHPARKVSRRAHISLERLEHRSVPAVITVTNRTDADNGNTASIANLIANDGGDGISLREAIEAANATPGIDEIQFDIGDAVQVIAPRDSSLPAITDGLIINGALRPAGRPNQQIVLSGAALPAAGTEGLLFENGSDGSRVWGLTMRGFANEAILMYNTSDIHVGGSGDGQGNILYDNNIAIGIGRSDDDELWGAFNVQVVGNLIGAPSTTFETEPVNGGSLNSVPSGTA